jgi:putative transposase
MSKQTNQKFIYIPYDMLIKQLEYKCQTVGVKFILTDESYTSGTSFLDGEIPCKENYDKSRRVKRGLFQASDRLINSDVNGSLQIMRKVFPDAFSYGIEGDLTPLIINAVRIA